MEILVQVGLLVLGLVTGLLVGRDLGLKSGLRSESQLRAEMLEALDSIEKAMGRDWEKWMAEQELLIQKYQEKVKALESDLRWEKVQRMHPKKKLESKK